MVRPAFDWQSTNKKAQSTALLVKVIRSTVYGTCFLFGTTFIFSFHSSDLCPCSVAFFAYLLMICVKGNCLFVALTQLFFSINFLLFFFIICRFLFLLFHSFSFSFWVMSRYFFGRIMQKFLFVFIFHFFSNCKKRHKPKSRFDSIVAVC